MGLYLCVFRNDRGDDEIDGVEVGPYADFDRFRATVAEHLERGDWGSRFPVLMRHDDADGTWTPAEAVALRNELRAITAGLARLPALDFPPGWQRDLARRDGIVPASLLDSFIDVDGEPLVERLAGLAETAIAERAPIWFQ